MQNQELMTISDVMQVNINLLENLRIPTTEPEIFNTVRAVINNCRVCYDAQKKAETEGEQNDAEAK